MPGSYSRLGLRQAVAVGVGRRFGAIGATRLAEDAADVVRGGVLADEQRRADLAVAESLRDQAEDLDLAGRQPVGKRRGRAGGPEPADTAEQRGHADALRQRVRLAEQPRGAVATA